MLPLEERKTTEFLAELRDSGVWGTYEIKNLHLEEMKVGKYLGEPSIHNEERGQQWGQTALLQFGEARVSHQSTQC